ncbi:MGMT family protein [Kineosporia succinea]|uniref:Alkylated DNA nucleotide flippase Atl1 n=1 Tax=Kineosporia succinea TaxID=84632 RepID=A0ABT9NYQ7_9ACTN|nr:MGMT family protein [Kineosporia succinea]MDP9825436.1 alkylated DNA nucleotide flippase Atl1 [Kineosporia succinea]
MASAQDAVTGDEDESTSSTAETYVADVLDVVNAIPPGQVLTYGDVAALVGHGGPRQVGKVMSQWGSLVPWWRVLRAGGLPPTGHEARALRAYAQEGTPLRPGGERVDLRRARWDPDVG